MKPYLQKFQGEAPVVSLMTTEVTVLLETDVEIHKTKQIADSKQSSQNCQIKCIGNRHSFGTADTDEGFAATTTLTKALKEKKLSLLQMYDFKIECFAVLVTTVTKTQERSPLKYSFARKLASLDTRLIVAEPDRAVNMFKQVLTNPDPIFAYLFWIL